MLDQPGGPASAAIADTGAHAGGSGRLTDACCRRALRAGTGSHADTASHGLALSGAEIASGEATDWKRKPGVG